MSNKIVVSVIGAGGKMGTRVTNNLAKHPDSIDLHFCEASEARITSYNVCYTKLLRNVSR